MDEAIEVPDFEHLILGVGMLLQEALTRLKSRAIRRQLQHLAIIDSAIAFEEMESVKSHVWSPGLGSDRHYELTTREMDMLFRRITPFHVISRCFHEFATFD